MQKDIKNSLRDFEEQNKIVKNRIRVFLRFIVYSSISSALKDLF